MNREINTLSIKGLLDKRFWVIIVFFMLTLPAYAVTNAFVVTGEVIDAVNNPGLMSWRKEHVMVRSQM